MSESPIQGLMQTAMQSIKEMVDVNTIVGEAVETPDGTVIIPISRVTFGFAAGGGDYEECQLDHNDSERQPFGGGSGAGISIRPVGFLVYSPGASVRFMPVEGNLFYDRLLDLVPELLNKIHCVLDDRAPNGEEKKQDSHGETRSSHENEIR
jgi:sporulation protein YtfJ